MVFGVLDRKHYNMMTKMLQFNDIFCNRKSWAGRKKKKGQGFETGLQFETVAFNARYEKARELEVVAQ